MTLPLNVVLTRSQLSRHCLLRPLQMFIHPGEIQDALSISAAIFVVVLFSVVERQNGRILKPIA